MDWYVVTFEVDNPEEYINNFEQYAPFNDITVGEHTISVRVDIDRQIGDDWKDYAESILENELPTGNRAAIAYLNDTVDYGGVYIYESNEGGLNEIDSFEREGDQWETYAPNAAKKKYGFKPSIR